MKVTEKRPLLLLAVVLAVVVLVAAYNFAGIRTSVTGARAAGSARNLDPVAFQKEMRELWTDHMQWTFLTVNAFFHNTGAVQAYLDRLLQNQQEIGAAFVPFYGKEAGDRLASLLTVHIQQAVPVLEAARAGDEAALDTALADWYANAREIADFISSLNPRGWPVAEMEEIWRAHIDQTTTYSLDVLNRNYAAAVRDYDLAFDHMMGLADVLSAGIIAQFPKRFRR